MGSELQALSLPMAESGATRYRSKAALDYSFHEKLVKNYPQEGAFLRVGR